ncbi:MAG: glucose-6-phosphate isomerase [bacterium]|nr:glucose-6-phosphate isomerase [bacterium]
MIKLSSKYVEKYDSISEQEKIKLKEIETIINEKASMLDWTDPNQTISQQDLEKIKEYTKKIQKRADLFLVIGIGGSYLGSKAVIEALSPYFSKKTPEVMFIGYHLSGTYLKELLNYITGKSIYVNVISKSGTTLETIACFEIIEKYMKENFSDYQDRIFVTTSKTNNHLTEIAIREHYHTLEIPENIGGRFSVLTPVGLFPIAVGGIDIQELLKGIPSNDEIFQLASRIALIRKHLEEDHKTVEAVTFYEKKLSSLSLWYQQLFAETQGKDEKGILPIPNFNTTNLHSIGQYFQDGKKQVFETVIKIEK